MNQFFIFLYYHFLAYFEKLACTLPSYILLTPLFHNCNTLTHLLHSFYTFVTPLATPLLHSCYTSVTHLLHLLLHLCYKFVTSLVAHLLHLCYIHFIRATPLVTLLLHLCYTFVTSLLHHCCTFVAPLVTHL